MDAPCIVIIEDDPALQQWLHTLLRADGYRTLCWDRGADAYDLLCEIQPDLVLLDLWLEDRHAGSKVLALLAGNVATRWIPVIVCTGFRQHLSDQIAALEAQGYVILEKPCDPQVLLDHVRQRCSKVDVAA